MNIPTRHHLVLATLAFTISVTNPAATAIISLHDICPDPDNEILQQCVRLILKDPNKRIHDDIYEQYDDNDANIHTELLPIKNKSDALMNKLWYEHRCHPSDHALAIKETYLAMLNKIFTHNELTPTVKTIALLRCKLDYRHYLIPSLQQEIFELQSQHSESPKPCKYQPRRCPDILDCRACYANKLHALIKYTEEDLIPHTDRLLKQLKLTKKS